MGKVRADGGDPTGLARLMAMRAQLLAPFGLTEDLVRRAVAVVDSALTAEDTMMGRGGQEFTRPNWDARLRAAENVLEHALPDRLKVAQPIVQVEFPAWFRETIEAAAAKRRTPRQLGP